MNAFERLECAALAYDIPDYGLQAGDLATVVGPCPEGRLYVQSVAVPSGTQALVTLGEQDMRRMDSQQ